MKSILVVEDSAMVMKVIKHVLSQSPFIRVDYATNFAEAKALVEQNDAYFAALVDLSLPDAPNGEVVDYVLSQSVPTIVLTASFDDKKREALLKKGIVDYVTKEGKYSYERALSTLHRLINNERIKVLVVDDSNAQRKLLFNLLKLHLFDVIEAKDGVDAIRVILDNPDIRLLITDFNMPRMDGCELVKNLRIKYEKSDLIIIGLSSESEGSLSARFIKYGANDFLRKPFNHEEFFCRINHNVEFLELIEKIRDAGNRDELTGVYNRKYFFRRGAEIHQAGSQAEQTLSLAVVEIDDIADVYRRYGIETVDQVMYQLGQRFAEAFQRFFLCRGDEDKFFIVFPGLDNDKTVAYVDRVRQLVASEKICTEEADLPVSFTAGVSSMAVESIDALLDQAEQCLERAKDTGGDIVIGD